MAKNDDAIWKSLIASRSPIARAGANADAGVYALFLATGSLPHVAPAADGLLYIGMTDSSLVSRNPLTHKSSGFSTLRRSLGSLLRAKLALVPIPRSAGSSPNLFKFSSDGEIRLTKWIIEHLDYGCAIIADDRDKLKKRLIGISEPPLNLTGWKNPLSKEIEARRKECVIDANRYRA